MNKILANQSISIFDSFHRSFKVDTLHLQAYVPAMFKKENLEEILREDRYQYILDRNCEQFEPDNPVYIATAETVYEHINLNKKYDVLWSTRHFGPMVFYYVWEKKCDDMIGNL